MRRPSRLLTFVILAFGFALSGSIYDNSALAYSFAVYAAITLFYVTRLPFVVDYETTRVATLLFEIVAVQIIQTFVLFFNNNHMAIASLWLYTFLFAALCTDYI